MSFFARDRTAPPPSRTRAPAGPLARLGRFTARRPWTVLIAGLLTLAFCAAVGVPTAASLVLSRFEAQGSESAGVAESLETGFDTGSSNITIVVTAKDGTVDDPEMVAAGTDLTAEIAGQAGVLDAYSYWTHDSTPTMRSDDSTQAVILARAPGDADQVRREVLPEFLDEFTRDTDSYRTQIGGGEAVFLDASNEATADFVRAEMIIFPTVLVLLLLVVRNVALAIAPVVVGLFTMAGTLALLRPVTWFLELSTFALNITLVMGLALGWTTACSSSTASGRNYALATPFPKPLSAASRSPAGRSSSVVSPSRRRCPCCWPYRSTSCVPSPTPASRW